MRISAHAYFSCAHDTPPRVQHFSSWVCVCVCVCVCLLSNISPMERLFVLKTLSRTQRATEVKKYVGFSLKPLRCRDPALPPLYGHAYSRTFSMRNSRVRACVFLVPHDTPPRVQHFSAFHKSCSDVFFLISYMLIMMYWQ